MDRTTTRVGQGFDDVASRTNITPDETNNIITNLANIDGNLDLTAEITPADKAVIRRNIDLIQNAAAKGNGTISGADYQALTKYKADIDRLASNGDPNVAAVGMQIKHVLDDGFQASASEADKAALTNLRYQWRLMKTVQPLAEKAQGASIDPGNFPTGLSPRRASWTAQPEASLIPAAAIGELGRIGRVIGRGPEPVSPSLVGDIMHPPGGPLGYMMDPKLAGAAHAAQVVGNQIAGPYSVAGSGPIRLSKTLFIGQT